VHLFLCDNKWRLICSVSWRWFQNLVAQNFEISPNHTPCSVTYTVKIIKIAAIVLTIIQTVTSWFITGCLNKKNLVHWNIESYVISHVITPDVTPLFYSQCSWRASLDCQGQEPKKNESCNKHNQTYFLGVYKLWVKNSFTLLALFVSF
jgi:hypothetical protein